MNKEKLRHYATVLGSHANSPWVTVFFFFVFFIDSLVLIIPVDSLLGATVSVAPRHAKKWLIASLLGFGSGLGLAAFLVNSQLSPWLMPWMEKLGYMETIRGFLEDAARYGYLSLTIGVFTVLPSLFGVLIGVIVGLNPWAVWAISFAGKILKVVLTVGLIFSGSQFLKKIFRWYLKTSV